MAVRLHIPAFGVLVVCFGCGSASEPDPVPGGMVKVPAAGSDYAIDATEVTRESYAEFLAQNPPATDQSSECAQNDSFVPATGWPPANDGRLPVVGVDQCDAVAYCSWAGKHLCGMRGTVADPHEAYNDEQKNEWYRACSEGEKRLYPYGGNPFDPKQVADAYRPGACNGKDKGLGAPAPVGSQPDCEGGYPGLFDMSGNVAEWTNQCDSGQCAVRSGSYQDPGPSGLLSLLDCTSTSFEAPDITREDLGFRCCK